MSDEEYSGDQHETICLDVSKITEKALTSINS